MPVLNIYKKPVPMRVIPRELVGVSGYNEFQNATGYAKAVIFFNDSLAVVNAITNNRNNLSALTFKNWSAGLQAKGYPSEDIRNGYEMADSFGLIPKSIKDRLTAKPAPAPAPAPGSSASKGSTAPGKKEVPAEHKSFFASIPWYGWAGIAVAAAGVGVIALKRKRA